MAGQHDCSGKMSFIAATAIAPNLRVKHGSTAGEVEIAGDEACIGVSYDRAYKAGDRITVLDIKLPGTLPFTASGAIAKGAAFTSAAGGKVASGTGGTQDYGVAMTAAAGDGELIEGTSGV